MEPLRSYGTLIFVDGTSEPVLLIEHLTGGLNEVYPGMRFTTPSGYYAYEKVMHEPEVRDFHGKQLLIADVEHYWYKARAGVSLYMNDTEVWEIVWDRIYSVKELRLKGEEK